MIDYSELSKYFDDIIEANSNPFFISWSETYKEGGELKTKYHKEEIRLEKVDSFIELIINNNNIEEIDYYPKTFFKKLFNIKDKHPQFDGDDSNFVLMSEKTQKEFKTNCVVYPLDEDNKVIVGKRTRLIYQIKDNDIYVNIDKSKFNTKILK
jgi:hypothetical protein